MHRSINCLFVMALLFSISIQTAVAAAGAPRNGNELVKVELLSDVTSIEPGKPFALGVKFVIEPGWHIYWINPGDAGQATEVKLELPPGFQVGPVQYPVPHKFTQAGDIVGYGYTDEVMLLTTITPPKNLETGASIALSAGANWLVCEKLCLPGEVSTTVNLPVTSKAESANSEAFARWRQMMPDQGPSIVQNKTASLDFAGEVLQGKIVVNWRTTLADIEWFPAPPDELALSGVKLTTADNLTTVTFTAKQYSGKKISELQTLSSVLAYTLPDGRRAGISIPIAIPLASRRSDSGNH